MSFRYTKWFFLCNMFLLAIIIGFRYSAPLLKTRTDNGLHSKIAGKFLLTDLCLTTESRHTRHFSQPELMAAFQDVPGWFDHFPSSSFFPIPDSVLAIPTTLEFSREHQ